MSSEPPVVDGRTDEDLLAEARARAPFYVPEWDPDAGDDGDVLLTLFSKIVEGVVERVDQVPEKHRVAFFDELGFSRRPPQPSRLPLTFTVADGVGRNVVIPPGTQAVTDDDLTFEVGPGAGFEATPAALSRVYGVDPGADQVFDHTGALAGGGGAELFDGADEQEHVLYVGHADQLNLGAGTEVEVTVEMAESGPLGDLVWEYYGEKDGVEDWHEFPREPDGAPPKPPWLELRPDALVERVESVLRPRGYTTVRKPSSGLSKPLLKRIRGDVREPGGSGAPVGSGLSRPRPAPDVDLVDELRSAVSGGGPPPGGVVPTPSGPGSVGLSFDLDGTIVETEVAGVESRWIRCRIPEGGSPQGRFDVEVDAVRLDATPAGLAPDAMFYNDVPLSADGGRFYPFGELPRPMDTFSLASEEAFTKKGTRVTVEFLPAGADGDGSGSESASDDAGGSKETDGGTDGRLVRAGGAGFERTPDPSGNYVRDVDPKVLPEDKLEADPEAVGTVAERVGSATEADPDPPDDPAPDPNLSWEYWNGGSWTRLAVRDGTGNLTRAGPVEFVVPDDLAATAVAGEDGYWIRVRIVGGGYGRGRYVEENGAWIRDTAGVEPPIFGGVEIGYGSDGGIDPEHLLTYNNLAYSDDLAEGGVERFAPFAALPDAKQTLYLGFDRPLDDGPINLFFPVADHEYPEGFHPRLRWEYCTDPERDEWTRLDVADGTEDLTRRGVVGLVFPEATTATTRFGEERHWVRARVAGDEFLPALVEPIRSDEPEAPPGVPDPCGETLETAPPAGEPDATPPTLGGIHPNTGWVWNVETVAGEVLGSSDGSPSQSFAVSKPPVTDEAVWVDELAALSAGRRRELDADEGVATEAVTGEDGDPREFWVRWEPVDDFVGSGEDARHYVPDRAAGRVVFGDGVDGRIPPRGRDNVRIDYRTGGGVEGNVPAGAVGSLKSSISYVDSVVNPEAGDGGAAEETMVEVLARAPRRLRDRGRAVAAPDFERVAMAASRNLARARCIPGLDGAGDRTPGWVTLLVVPQAQGAKPTPSVELEQQVLAATGDRAPVPLVDPDRLVVRGPSYVEVSVDTTLGVVPGASVSTVEADAGRAVDGFLHPLSGGEDGTGWDFGELPCPADLYALLEGVAGVDHVAELALTFRGTGEAARVTEGDPVPGVAEDVLICAGTHDVRARGGR